MVRLFAVTFGHDIRFGYFQMGKFVFASPEKCKENLCLWPLPLQACFLLGTPRVRISVHFGGLLPYYYIFMMSFVRVIYRNVFLNLRSSPQLRGGAARCPA